MSRSLRAIDERLLSEIIRWDVGNWSQALRLWERRVDWSNVHTCLELGGREGGLSLWLALKDKAVVCSDIVDVQKFSQEIHRKHRVEHAIQYQYINATNIPYENHFDVIAFKSMLGDIGGHSRAAQQTALDQIYKALKPGGKLLFAENLAASSLHSLARRKFIRWGRDWRYVTVNDVREFLGKFAGVELHTTGVMATFGRTERQRRMLAKLDRGLLNHITPSAWQYIVYGIAEKPLSPVSAVILQDRANSTHA